MSNNTLVILGAGQQGRNCHRLAPINGYQTVAFVDDFITDPVEDIRVYSKIEDIPDFMDHKYIVAVGDLAVRKSSLSRSICLALSAQT